MHINVFVNSRSHAADSARTCLVFVVMPLGAPVIVVLRRKTKTQPDVRSLLPNKLLHFTLVHARAVGEEMRVKLIK